jgi:hypothetical protein
MRGPRRYLFLLELLVCFAPCSFMALASIVIVGPSVSLVLEKLSGNVPQINDVPWLDAIEPLLLSFASLLGLFALLREHC